MPAPGQAKKVAIIGSLDHVTRQLSVHTSQTKRSRDFIAHLEQLDHLFGPHPGRAIKPVVLVEDNGPVHVSKLTLKAIEARKHWLTVEWLPKYAPELNDIEVVWHDLKARHLAHQTFADADALDRAIHAAVAALNRERTVNPLFLEALQVEAPTQVRGVSQSPIEGVSFAHVFQDAKAESRHKTQYFEMFAHRSIYHDGWRAVCPVPGTSFKESGTFFGMLTLTEDMLRELDAKHWELYDLSKDPTETTDLAAANRAKLIEMIALWYTEAGKYKVFPLDSRGTLRFADERPELTKDRKTYVYYPHTQMIPENVAAKLLNKSHSLTAEVEIPKGGAEGVLICHGGNVGGYTLFVKDKKLHYVHNYVGAEEFHVASNMDVPAGKVSLRYEFEKTGEPDLKTGKGAAGKAQLYINKKLVGELKLPYTVPLALGIGSGVFIGRNSGSPVTRLYGPPFEFTGTINEVTVDISGKLIADTEEEKRVRAKVAMARQ